MYLHYIFNQPLVSYLLLSQTPVLPTTPLACCTRPPDPALESAPGPRPGARVLQVSAPLLPCTLYAPHMVEARKLLMHIFCGSNYFYYI